MFSIPPCAGVIDGLFINMQQFSRWASPSPCEWPDTTARSRDGWEWAGEGAQAGRALGAFRHGFRRCWCTTLIFKLPTQALVLQIFKEKPLDSGERLLDRSFQPPYTVPPTPPSLLLLFLRRSSDFLKSSWSWSSLHKAACGLSNCSQQLLFIRRFSYGSLFKGLRLLWDFVLLLNGQTIPNRINIIQ